MYSSGMNANAGGLFGGAKKKQMGKASLLDDLADDVDE